MRIHYLQHVLFEDLANIAVWAKRKGYHVSGTMLFNNEDLPPLHTFDWLIIMGGPMNVYEEDKYPWLQREKEFIKQAIVGQKIVLGICLGAQLIADVLDAKVYQGKHKEIGWFPVKLSSEVKKTPIFHRFPDKFMAFHWHGDTFEIPSGAIRAAESKACANQAFVYNEHVVGLQFHLESSKRSVTKLIKNCFYEIVEGKYIQTAEKMIEQKSYFDEINNLMCLLLNNMEKV